MPHSQTWFQRKPLTPQQQVERAITKLEKSNALIVSQAHLFAMILIVATSVASLISLALDVLQHVLIDQGRNIPNDASVIITLVLVLAMDTGMILAATYIRLGRERAETWHALVGHIAIMLIVAVLEAGTYCYMLFKYETPTNWEAAALIIARGLAVPVLSIYLAMAEKITVTTADIARLTEIFSGVGLLKDLASEANNTSAPLHKKIAIYRAAATLSPAQRAKLDAMYQAVAGQTGTGAPGMPAATSEGPSAPAPGDEQNQVDTPQGQASYDATSPELLAYVLPANLTLTTMDSKRHMAQMLGIRRVEAISEAMNTIGMIPAGAATGQAHNAHNIAVWQILSLVECGLLEMPSQVSKGVLQAV